MTEDRVAGAIGALGFALFAVIAGLLTERPTGTAVALGAASLMVGVLVWLTRVEGWLLATGLLVGCLGIVALGDGQAGNLGWFGLCVAACWVAFLSPARVAAAFCVALVAVIGWEAVRQLEEAGWGAWIGGTILATVIPAFSRRQQILLDQLREAQAGLAARARAEERNRLAGEMHDVIGHALTVSLLHVSSARLALDEDPETARVELDEAERLARASLEEVRASVGLMREQTGTRPLPTGADIPELVESFRRAGTSVELTLAADPDLLGATRGLAVYRVVQGALTNVTRHAPGRPATVRIGAEDGRVTVSVTNHGPVEPTAVFGNGLRSMRDRVEAVGGGFEAGATDDGWSVAAWVPA